MEGLKTNSQKWDLQPPPYTSLADMGPSHIPRIGCIPISFYRSPLCPKNPVLCPKDFRGFPPTKIQGDVFRPSKSYGRPVGGSKDSCLGIHVFFQRFDRLVWKHQIQLRWLVPCQCSSQIVSIQIKVWETSHRNEVEVGSPKVKFFLKNLRWGWMDRLILIWGFEM